MPIASPNSHIQFRGARGLPKATRKLNRILRDLPRRSEKTSAFDSPSFKHLWVSLNDIGSEAHQYQLEKNSRHANMKKLEQELQILMSFVQMPGQSISEDSKALKIVNNIMACLEAEENSTNIDGCHVRQLKSHLEEVTNSILDLVVEVQTSADEDTTGDEVSQKCACGKHLTPAKTSAMEPAAASTTQKQPQSPKTNSGGMFSSLKIISASWVFAIFLMILVWLLAQKNKELNEAMMMHQLNYHRATARSWM